MKRRKKGEIKAVSEGMCVRRRTYEGMGGAVSLSETSHRLDRLVDRYDSASPLRVRGRSYPPSAAPLRESRQRGSRR